MSTRILIVEDEMIIAEDVRAILKSLDYKVLGVASSGEQALEMVQDNPPDLALMDIKISGPMNGIETSKRIRSMYDIPVVFLTAYADPDTMERVKETQAYGFIVKPSNRQTIQGTIELALYKHGMDSKLHDREERLEHLNQVLRAIRNVNQLITKEANCDQLIQGVCDCLSETLGYHRAWIALYENEARFNKFAYNVSDAEFLPLKKLLADSISKYPACVKHTLKNPGLSVVSSTGKSCRQCPLYDPDLEFSRFTMRLEYANRVFGVMSVAVPIQYQEDEEEQELFRELVDDVAFAMYKFELEAAREKAQNEIQSLSKFPSENPNPVLRIGADGRVLYHNQAGDDILTYICTKSKTVLKKKWKDIVQDILKSNQVHQREIDVNRKTYSITWTPIKEFQYVNIYGLDISPRKKMEVQLQESEEKYHALYNQSVEGIFVHDLEGQIIDVNQMACQQTGYAREELLTMSVFDILPGNKKSWPMPKSEILHQWHQWKPGQKFILKVDHQRKEGTVFPVEISTGVIRYGGNDQILAIVQDITERKQSENALRESEERYRALVDNMDAFVYMIDKDGRVISLNLAAARFLGGEHDQFTGKSLSRVFAKDIAKKYMSSIKKVFQTGKSLSTEREIVIHGRQIWLIAHLSPVHDVSGKVTAVIGSSRDITERKTAELKLRENEQFMTSVFESIQDGISILNPDLTIRATNGLMREWYKPNLPLEGQKCFQCYQGAKQPCDPCPSLRCIESKKTEFDVLPGLPGSTVKSIELYSYPIIDPDSGKVTGVVEFVRDITQRRDAEDALRHSDSLMKRIAANYPHSYISIIEKDMTVGFTSGQEFKNQGLNPDDFVGLSLNEVFEEKASLVKKQYRKTFRGEETSFEMQMGEQYQLCRTVPLADEDGTINRILAVVENITERKHIEEALKESEENFKRTALELQAIIDALPGLVSVVDREFNVLVANAAVIDTFGQSDPNEVLQKKCYTVRKGLKEICHQCAIKKAFKTGKTVARVSTPDEEKLMGMATKAYAVPLRDEKGKIWGGVEVILDVSDLRQIENDLIEKMKELEKFNRLMVGREERMIELKREVNALYREMGRRRKYKVPDDVL